MRSKKKGKEDKFIDKVGGKEQQRYNKNEQKGREMNKKIGNTEVQEGTERKRNELKDWKHRSTRMNRKEEK